MGVGIPEVRAYILLRNSGLNAEDKKKLIDTHYGASAAKAVLMNPKDLIVQEKSQEEFEKMLLSCSHELTSQKVQQIFLIFQFLIKFI